MRAYADRCSYILAGVCMCLQVRVSAGGCVYMLVCVFVYGCRCLDMLAGVFKCLQLCGYAGRCVHMPVGF